MNKIKEYINKELNTNYTSLDDVDWNIYKCSKIKK